MYLKRLTNLVSYLNQMEKLQTAVPHAIHIIQHMKTVMKFQLQDFEFYQLGNSEEECPPIVSVYRKRLTPQVTMFMRDEDANLMKNALHEIIDWKKCNHFYCIPTHQVPILKEVIGLRRAKVVSDYSFITIRCENIKALPDLNPTDISKVRLLTEDDVHLIHKHWVYRFWEDSEETVRQCINMRAGYGICLDDKLVSWCMMTYRGDVGLAHTLPEARSYGYATVTNIFLMRQLFLWGLTPIGRIESTNTAALNGTKNIGYKKMFIQTSDLTSSPEC